jgi:hypothetical protein
MYTFSLAVVEGVVGDVGVGVVTTGKFVSVADVVVTGVVVVAVDPVLLKLASKELSKSALSVLAGGVVGVLTTGVVKIGKLVSVLDVVAGVVVTGVLGAVGVVEARLGKMDDMPP